MSPEPRLQRNGVAACVHGKICTHLCFVCPKGRGAMTEERVSGHGTGADRSDLAGQYALGLLDGDERVVFERRLKESAELRDEVARWQEHFTALGMNVYQSDLPLSVFDHLKRELWSENRLP
ncbi:conserved hypothetical protein [Rhodobacteraceae bacterium HTCC2083]|nr:conserved hypothetical protein [Rhodobacteraceae bacterium HTCC2083]